MKTARVLSLVSVLLVAGSALADHKAPMRVSIDVSQITPGQMQLEFALHDFSERLGDSWVLIDNVKLDGTLMADFESGTLDGFDVSLNPDSVAVVEGSIDSTGESVLRLDESSNAFVTLIWQAFPGGQTLEFDLRMMASGIPGPLGLDTFVVNVADLSVMTPGLPALTPDGLFSLSNEGVESESGVTVRVLVTRQTPRASLSTKGSVLIFPKVECWFDSAQPYAPGANILRDTFISITNDAEQSVLVHLFFVSDTCRHINTGMSLTHNNPAWFSAATGQPGALNRPVPAFWSATQTGLPQWDANIGAYVARGYIVAVAVDPMIRNIRHNFLGGEATTVDYMLGTAFDYKAYAFKALQGQTGDPVGVPGTIKMDGVEYSESFNTLLLDFVGVGSTAFSGDLRDVFHDTDLTLMIHQIDVRRVPGRPELDPPWLYPYHTQVTFDWIWNENETPFSNENYCIRKWDSRLLSNVLGAFEVNFLGTNRGYARIDGLGDPSCGVYDVVHNPPYEELVESSIDTALLGVATKVLEMAGAAGTSWALAGGAMRGSGTDEAWILYDVLSGGEEQPGTLGGPDVVPHRILDGPPTAGAGADGEGSLSR